MAGLAESETGIPHLAIAAAMKIILFDGQCMLCNGFVGFVLRQRNPHLFLCDLHGAKGQEILRTHNLPTQQFSTIYFLDGDTLYSKSTAVLQILKNLKAFYAAVASAASLVPVALRDAVYGWVARHRHRLWKKETCLFPDAFQRKQILS